MFRPRFLLSGLAAFLLGGCSPQDPYADVSASLTRQLILPSYQSWLEADRALASSAHAYCAGDASLEQARDDFRRAQSAWARLQPVLVGPLAEGNQAWRVMFWPDKKNLVARQVEQLIGQQPQLDAARLEKESVVVQGLSAYEYILFDPQIEQLDAASRTRYCPLLQAIGQRQLQLAEQTLSSWNAEDGMASQLSQFPNPRYAESREAIAELLRAQITAIDTLKKKLGAALGRQSKGIAQPFQAESWRSDASLVTLAATLDSARALWSGEGSGLRLLLGAEHQPLAERIEASYDEAIQQLAALDQPLSVLLGSAEGRARLNGFYDNLNAVHRIQEGELAKALNIQIGFNANDGD